MGLTRLEDPFRINVVMGRPKRIALRGDVLRAQQVYVAEYLLVVEIDLIPFHFALVVCNHIRLAGRIRLERAHAHEVLR